MLEAGPCLPSPTRRMNVSVCHAEGWALLVGTGESLGVHPLGCSSPAFDLAAGTRHPQVPALHSTRQGRRDDRRDNRVGSGASGDGGACCAWPLLVRRKTEDGTSQDAKAAPKRGGGKPRAGTRRQEWPEKSSLLEVCSMESFLIIRRVGRDCQVIGRTIRMIHHRETLYPTQNIYVLFQIRHRWELRGTQSAKWQTLKTVTAPFLTCRCGV